MAERLAWINGFAWGFAIAFVIDQARQVVRTWRQAKAEVNAVRREHGLPEERRWWRL